MNICGCLVHVSRDLVFGARAAMEALKGVEVHAQTDDGRFVVVVEDTAASFASDTLMALHQIPGVISLTLNYHHFEDVPPRRPNPQQSRRVDACPSRTPAAPS